VAQSKGAVQPRFTGVDAVQPGSEAGAAAPESAGEAKTAARRGRQKKAKEKGGGLLGALFGRVSKTKKISAAARTKPKQRAAPASAGESEPSIIESVAAERLAASEPAPAVEQAPEVGPLVEPLFESHGPDTGAGIVLPELEPELMESLEPELPAEDPFAPAESDSPLMVEVSPADQDESEDDLIDDLEDDLSDLIGEEPEDDLSDLQPPPSMAATDEQELEDSEDVESPVDLFDEDALGGSLDGPEEPEAEARAMDEDDLRDLIGEDDVVPVAESGSDAGPPEGFMGVDLGDAEAEDLDPEAPAGGRVDFDTTMYDFARIPADEAAPPPVPPRGFDDEPAEQLRESSTEAEPESAPAKPKRKPAKLKLSYKRPAVVVREYRENLSRGGCFVRTSKPLSVEREVSIEVRVAGLDESLIIPGIVTWSSGDATELEPGQEQGMGIEYQLDSGEVARITAVLDRLEGGGP
jgi:Tfp pilus assembly protein PilZ